MPKINPGTAQELPPPPGRLHTPDAGLDTPGSICCRLANRSRGLHLVNTLPTPARPHCHLNCRLTNHRPENLPPNATNPPGRSHLTNPSNTLPDSPANRPKPSHQSELGRHRPQNCHQPNQNQEDLPPTFTNPPSIKIQSNQHFNSQNCQTPTKLQRNGPKSPPKKTPQQKRKLFETQNEEYLPPQKETSPTKQPTQKTQNSKENVDGIHQN